jgi:hypothetical protein
MDSPFGHNYTALAEDGEIQMRLRRISCIAVFVIVALSAGRALSDEGRLTDELSPSIRSLQRLHESVVDAVALLKRHPKDKPVYRRKVIDEASIRYQQVQVCINPLIDSIVRDIKDKVEMTPDRYTREIDQCKSRGLDFTDFINKHVIRFNEASMLDALEGLGPAIEWLKELFGKIISSGGAAERDRLIQDLENQRLPDFREIT